MKFFLTTILALIGLAAAAQLPDSATQGPNPQDIATPEPEYIDIDEPLPAAAPAAPPAAPASPIQTRIASIAPRPIQRPVIAAASTSFGRVPNQQYLAPQRQQQSYQPARQNQLPGHAYSSQRGYQYRRPVYVRRLVYRHRY